MRRLRRVGIAFVIALLMSLANMVATVLAGPGPTPPTVQTQRDCPEVNGESRYLYADAKGHVFRCLGN